ncbi:MAG TPA: OmpA family protein, partial [Polyangiaceae bacterium]|nr:OmpA family protein [Polyangiaceae bacterium]
QGQGRHAVEDTSDVRRESDELVFLLSTQLDRREVRQALAEIHKRLTGRRLDVHTRHSPFSPAGEAEEQELRDALFHASDRGALLIQRVEPARTFITLENPVIPPEMRPQETVEEALSDFAVRFIDDAGESISGLELNFACRGKKETVTTDGDGVAQFKQYEGSFGQLTVKDPKKLAEILEPRFEKPSRPRVKVDGKFTDMILTDELSAVQLESAVMGLVIVRPEPGQIFLDLFDKTGQVSHNLVDYEITGPMSFSGTTSETGQVQHADVVPGDYKLKFTLTYPDALKIDPRSFELPVVVLDASDSSPQVRLVGAVPVARMARIRGALFDTNKTFLLPTALESLHNYRDILHNKGPSQLVLVGHTDTQGKEKDNQKLSVARADSVKQFLSGGVDDWLKNYDAGAGGSTKWGAREDRLMIVGLCDAESRQRAAAGIEPSEVHPDPQNHILWYQTRHNEQVRLGDKEGEELKEDGITGPKTRKQLVTDYMKLIGEPWTAHADLPLEIFTTGLGEDCPLDSTGLEMDQRAVDERDEEADPIDRRVEFFFFDQEFGAAPLSSPPTDDSPPSKDDYLVWRQHLLEEVDANAAPINSQATLVPLTDAHFRTGSAVMLPEGETPSDGAVPAKGAKQALTSVGALATALRFNEERTGHKLLVAGHTDTVGSDKDNDKLSEQRAQLVHAVLTGGSEGRSKFQDLANETGKVSDWKQILKWASAAFPAVEALVSDEEAEEGGADGTSGDPNAASTGASDSGGGDEEPKAGELGTGFSAADPGVIDDNASTGKSAVEAFQTAYNENHKFLGGSGEIGVDGEVGKETWGAIYDLYQYNLAQELGENFDGLKKLQGLVEFLPTKQPYIGFGESAPVDGTHDDNAEEQADRRVEVLFFAQGQEPDIALLDEDPKVSELYHPDAFRRVEIDVASARPHRGIAAPLRIWLLDEERKRMGATPSASFVLEKMLGAPYRLVLPDGEIRVGYADDKGRATEYHLPSQATCQLWWGRAQVAEEREELPEREEDAVSFFKYRSVVHIVDGVNPDPLAAPLANMGLSGEQPAQLDEFGSFYGDNSISRVISVHQRGTPA